MVRGGLGFELVHEWFDSHSNSCEQGNIKALEIIQNYVAETDAF